MNAKESLAYLFKLEEVIVLPDRKNGGLDLDVDKIVAKLLDGSLVGNHVYSEKMQEGVIMVVPCPDEECKEMTIQQRAGGPKSGFPYFPLISVSKDRVSVNLFAAIMFPEMEAFLRWLVKEFPPVLLQDEGYHDLTEHLHALLS